MDKEEARFILRCFRPDGADAENPDFAEALALAAKDRELGEWLAHERASDAGFADALNAVSIPSSLRDEIMAGLALERGDAVGLPDSFDRSLIGAMASVRPPVNLRNEILAAMDRSAAVERSRGRSWRLFALPFAAAAGIACAFLLTRPDGTAAGPQPPFDHFVPISIGTVEEGFIKEFETPGFTLDLKNPDHHALFQHLQAAKLPCPNACLPEGLKDIPGLGCRKLEIDGKKGALVCFKQENDVVHLVAFKRCDVKCKLPQKGEKPDICRHGKWSVARWADDDWVYVLMGEDNVDTKRLADLFSPGY